MFRRTFDLEVVPEEAPARITADSRYVLWVNGQEVGRGPGALAAIPAALRDYGLRGRAFRDVPCADTARAPVGTVIAGPAQLNEGECGRDQHEPAADKQRHVQAVDEGAVRERLGSGAELLRDDAALSAAHVLDDVRGTCLG